MTAVNTYAYQIFYDRTNWENAIVGSLKTDNFDNKINNADSITFDSGVVSTSLKSSEYNRILSSGSYFGSVTSTSTLTWVFPWEILAFGFDIISINSGSQISGNFDGLGNEIFNPANDNISNQYNGFIGVIGNDTFDTIVFSGAGNRDSFSINNLSFSKAPTIPEPATLLLMGLGLFCLSCKRKKSHRDRRNIY
ncbi:PEP-CTERM sorting domain-containing protein [sulfur-oxidizing endosymbiont of Gigantopelta aegis]|uniref:PEP-CTERM sorting domain-containing protein n=1 Tax=sulfur-oxidizing endosymbiont of Gigantopelta aegis TaxID=2794934 RepID=UPI0018DC6022|nr:PEP-CTERM sorting domain-containing protein [sulfur-oxidizing endosymbiont of Gigantopelta aegis]